MSDKREQIVAMTNERNEQPMTVEAVADLLFEYDIIHEPTGQGVSSYEVAEAIVARWGASADVAGLLEARADRQEAVRKVIAERDALRDQVTALRDALGRIADTSVTAFHCAGVPFCQGGSHDADCAVPIARAALAATEETPCT